MALNFPDTPVNGEKYVASNGVEYTYEISNDTWTGNTADLVSPANPDPSDVTSVPPFDGGDGTKDNPYVLTPALVPVPGGTATSIQYITVIGQPALSIGTWEVQSGGVARFTQPPALFNSVGRWQGHLQYEDVPPSETGQLYDGLLVIGTTYFSWDVIQVANKTVFTPVALPNASPATVDYALDDKFGTVVGTYSDPPGTLTATGAAQFSINGAAAATTGTITLGDNLSVFFDETIVDAAVENSLVLGSVSNSAGFLLTPSILIDRSPEPFTIGNLENIEVSTVATSGNLVLDGFNCRSYVSLGSGSNTLTDIEASVGGRPFVDIPSSVSYLSLIRPLETGVITAYNETTKVLTFADNTELSLFTAADAVRQDTNYTPVTSVITSVAPLTNVATTYQMRSTNTSPLPAAPTVTWDASTNIGDQVVNVGSAQTQTSGSAEWLYFRLNAASACEFGLTTVASGVLVTLYGSADGATWVYIGEFNNSTRTATSTELYQYYAYGQTEGSVSSYTTYTAQPVSLTVLTLTNDTNLANFRAGDQIQGTVTSSSWTIPSLVSASYSINSNNNLVSNNTGGTYGFVPVNNGTVAPGEARTFTNTVASPQYGWMLCFSENAQPQSSTDRPGFGGSNSAGINFRMSSGTYDIRLNGTEVAAGYDTGFNLVAGSVIEVDLTLNTSSSTLTVTVNEIGTTNIDTAVWSLSGLTNANYYYGVSNNNYVATFEATESDNLAFATAINTTAKTITTDGGSWLGSNGSGDVGDARFVPSENWTPYLVTTSQFLSPAANAFDGNQETFAATEANGTLTFAPDLNIPALSTIEGWFGSGTDTLSDMTVTVNGVVNNNVKGGSWQSISYNGSTTLSSMTIKRVAPDNSADLRGLRINGKELISTAVPGAPGETQVTGPLLTAPTGVFASADTAAKTMTLTSTDATGTTRWVVNGGRTVLGPVKDVQDPNIFIDPGETMYIRGTTGSSSSTDYYANIKIGNTTSQWTVKTTDSNPQIQQPAIVLPVNGAKGIIPDIELVGSSYVGLDSPGTHASSGWQVYQANLGKPVSSAITTVTETTGQFDTWEADSIGFGTSDVKSLNYGGGYFLVGGANGKVNKSTDGINWPTTCTTITGAGNINQFAYGNGIWLAVTDFSGSPAIFRSIDGTTWVNLNVDFHNDTDATRATGVVFAKDTWIVSTDGTEFKVSSDNGQNWSAVKPYGNRALNWNQLAYCEASDKFICGQSSTGTEETVATSVVSSTTGYSWTGVGLSNWNPYNKALGMPGVGNPDGLVVLCGGNSQGTASTNGFADGSTSVTAPNPTNQSNIQSFVYGEGRWIAAGSGGGQTVSATSVGVTGLPQTWTDISTTVGINNYASIALFAGGVWLIGGAAGQLFYSIASSTTLVCQNNSNFAEFSPGDKISEVGGDARGTVQSVTPGLNTMKINSVTGTWTTGSQIKNESGAVTFTPGAPTTDPPTSSVYTAVVLQSADTTNLVEYPLTESEIIPDKVYYSRVRYTSNSSPAINSPYSDYSEFTTNFKFTLDPGDEYEGGYYVAQIKVADVIYNIVVAPLTQGLLEGQYGGSDPQGIQWRNPSAEDNPKPTDQNYGGLITQTFNDGYHPMFQWCSSASGPNGGTIDLASGGVGDGTGIGGFTDWYIPARNEQELCYRYLKPSTTPNFTGTGGDGSIAGTNSSAVPPTGDYTVNDPVQTSVAIFAGGTQTYATSDYWDANGHKYVQGGAQIQNFDTGQQSSDRNLPSKENFYFARAIRRVAA